MAYDKVVDSAQLDADLASVASKIKEKAGVTEGIVFPQGFLETLDSISAGGDSDDVFKNLIERTVKDLTIPDGATQIGSYSFFTYTDLETISLPNSLTNIGKYAFYSCSRLGFSLSSLPDGITKIDESAFYDCMSLGLTSLPNGLIEIKNNAFSGCGRLAITTLPSGITTIGDRAFGYCSKLSTITFLGTPSSIYSTAFTKCDNLTVINVPWAEGEVDNAPWGAKNATINYNYTGE